LGLHPPFPFPLLLSQIPTQFPKNEAARAQTALAVLSLLTPIASGASLTPAQLAEAAASCTDSLFRDASTYPRPVRLRRHLLPPQTQRLLEATGYTVPKALQLHGKMYADTLLPFLLDRHQERFQKPLLLPAASGGAASSSSSSSAPRSYLPVAATDAVLCMFLNYVVSGTRLQLTAPERPHPLILPEPLRVPAAHERHRLTPLAYASIDDLTESHPYNDLVYEYVGNVFLPSHVPFGQAHPDSAFFLHACVAYWLTQNPPFLVPLPGQSPESASALPASEYAQRQVFAIAASAAVGASGDAGRPPPMMDHAYGPAGPDLGRGTNGNGYGASSNAGSGGAAPGAATVVRSHSLTAGGALTLKSTGNGASAGGADAGAGTTAASSSSPAAGGAGEFETRHPVPSASAFVPPTLPHLEAVVILLVMLMCDVDFPEVVDGTNGAIPRSGGRRIVELAAETWDKGQDAYVDPVAEKDVQWDLARCPSLQRGWARVDPARLRADIPGMIVLPESLAVLHAPLFHFFRNALTRVDVDREPVLFASLFDAWLTIVTPWRARPRYKSSLPSYGDLRKKRGFAYTGVAASLLQQRVDEARAAASASAAQNGGGNGGGGGGKYETSRVLCFPRRRLRRVVVTERTGQDGERDKHRAPAVAGPVLHVSGLGLQELLLQVRTQGSYDALFTDTHDFEGKLLPNLFNAPAPVGMWLPWIRLHYLFIAHLLPLVLDRLSRATFTGTNGPVLMEVLERLLDFLEAPIVAELRACDALWRGDGQTPGAGLFRDRPVDPSRRSAEQQRRVAELLQQQDVQRSQMGVGVVKPVDKERLAARLQLLAHATLLKLPPDVSPRALAQPIESSLERAGELVRRLQLTMGLGIVAKPPPITIPESSAVVLVGASGKAVVFERPAFWEGWERILAAWISLLFWALLWGVAFFWVRALDMNDVAARLRGHASAAEESAKAAAQQAAAQRVAGQPAALPPLAILPPLPTDPAAQQAMRLSLRQAEQARMAALLASVLIAPFEGVWIWLTDLVVMVRGVAYFLLGKTVPASSSSSSTSSSSSALLSPRGGGSVSAGRVTEAERLQVVIDRLSRLIAPSVVKSKMERPSFFVLQAWRPPALSTLLGDSLTALVRWAFLIGPPPPRADAAAVLDPLAPAEFVVKGTLDKEARASIVGGASRVGLRMRASDDSGSNPDLVPARTWESRHLLTFTAMLSAALRPFVLEARSRAMALLVALRVVEDLDDKAVTPSASSSSPSPSRLHYNYLRPLADVSRLLFYAVLGLIWSYTSFTVMAVAVVLGYVLLRYLA
jgi:hypothetical protein